ncbi:hypothetical protein THRCLA_08412 [Thraustotheca clavata]|uniref:WRKY19-like zinc finger domain-containing protein n=1 Tax=Thraustotheca clavata TaxID=74557 RepID=A0A1V9Z6Q8_9STRA|nr:hypothetical protein THRCLA_08412 [Thraustotheca clavata]
MSQQQLCAFRSCVNIALNDAIGKCEYHKDRKMCSKEDCQNQVYARNLCVRHGGKKPCAFEGCTSYAKGGTYCLKHGGQCDRRLCSVDGCSKQAHARQLCVRHGGGRSCKIPSCQQHVRMGGYCQRHYRESLALKEQALTAADTTGFDFDYMLLSLLIDREAWEPLDFDEAQTCHELKEEDWSLLQGLDNVEI